MASSFNPYLPPWLDLEGIKWRGISVAVLLVSWWSIGICIILFYILHLKVQHHSVLAKSPEQSTVDLTGAMQRLEEYEQTNMEDTHNLTLLIARYKFN